MGGGGAGEGGIGVKAGALDGLEGWRVSWSGVWVSWVGFGGGGGGGLVSFPYRINAFTWPGPVVVGGSLDTPDCESTHRHQ